jgi:hypothetical protein
MGQRRKGGARDADKTNGWARHGRDQRRRMARLPLTKKLRWLEEAQEIVDCLARRRGRRPSRRRTGIV